MKTPFLQNLKALALCAGFLSLFSCREKSLVPPGLVPDVDNIHTFRESNFDLTVENKYRDSLVTSDYTQPVVAVGHIQDDPFFGKTTAGVYVQFGVPSSSFFFPEGTVADSAVLVVPYTGFSYGDTLSAPTLHFQVHRIAEDFDLDRTYYAFDRLAYETGASGSASVSLASLKDTTILGNDTVSSQLRIRLSNSLVNDILTADTSVFANHEAFRTYFKGLYLGTDTSQAQNLLSYFYLTPGGSAVSGNMRMVFYYHTATDEAQKTASFPYVAGSSAAFNHISRNYTGTPAAAYRNFSGSSDSLLIQGIPGYRSEVSIRLDNTSMPPSVINTAELTINVLKSGSDDLFGFPPQLMVYGINEDGTERVIADMVSSSGTSLSNALQLIGGASKTVTIDGQAYTQYVLNLPRELQRAISAGESNLKLRLSAYSSYPGAYRMVGAGPGAVGNIKINFSVIYTRLQ